MAVWSASSLSSVACRSGRPAAKLMRVQVMWSSQSLRMPSWNASCRASSGWRGWGDDDIPSAATGRAMAADTAAMASSLVMPG